MSGSEIFLDTNACIYFLNGDEVLTDFLHGQNIYISVITEIELFAFHGSNTKSIEILNDFINSITVLDIDKEIKALTIQLRKIYKLKIPDTIIAASALALSLPIITADKSFKKIADLDLILHDPTS
jgi:predicted nucleic acid-binding protein